MSRLTGEVATIDAFRREAAKGSRDVSEEGIAERMPAPELTDTEVERRDEARQVRKALVSLPPDQRFYAGGSATVRGFRYQSIGPQFPNGKPIGGQSIDAATIEFRQRLLTSFGAVAFVDAGRGWLVGPSLETLRYSSHSFPRFGTFRTDVGLGLDLGIFGVYVAKAVSSSKEPANVFLRVRRRF